MGRWQQLPVVNDVIGEEGEQEEGFATLLIL